MIYKKIFSLLNKKEKKNFFFLFILIFILASSEMIGVASIFPFISLIASDSLIETNQFINKAYKSASIIGIKNTKEFLILFSFFFYFILFFTIVLRAYTQYYQLKFSNNLNYNLSKRLIENYLHQPYNWFLSRNTADLSRNILKEVDDIVSSCIIPFINIITQASIILLLIFLLILVDPLIAFSVGLMLATSYVCIFFFIKKILTRYSLLRYEANQDRFKTLSEVFGAIKEVKFSRLESVFAQRYLKSFRLNIMLGLRVAIIQQFPRHIIETIAFGGLIFLVILLDKRTNELQNTFAIIGLYVFAGYRLLPSFQNLFLSISQIRFSNSNINLLYDDLTKLKFEQIKRNLVPVELKKKVSLENVSYFYPKSKYTTLENINITIPAFSKVGIVGVTGSGKTTIIDMILGLLDPSQGTLKIDDAIINLKNKRNWQKKIGYVPQQVNLVDASIAENIAFGIEKPFIDQNALDRATKVATIHDFIINDLPKQYDTIVGEKGVRLSGGQRQRIGIARALYHKPKVLILDEATSALDNFTETLVISAINKLEGEITTIIVSHRLNLVKNCDIIFLLEKGRVVAKGSFQDLYRSNLFFKKMSLNNF